MNLTEKTILLALILCSGCLALAGFLEVSVPWMILGPATGLVWWRSRRTGITWLPGAGLAAFTLWAVIGVLTRLPAVLMLLTVTAALGAWDLERLAVLVRQVEPHETNAALQRAHIFRLSMVILTGFLVGILALYIELQFNFLVTAAVILLLAFSLSRLIRLIRSG
jgi:hypothetical protein